MSDISDMMLATLDGVVEDTLTVAERAAADGQGMSSTLWAALEAQGMTALGEVGHEIAYADALALVRRAAWHAAPVPLAETIAARRLLSRAGIPLPAGPVAIVVPGARDAAALVTWGRSAPHAVAARGDRLLLLETAGAITRGGINQAGEPRDAIDLGRARVVGEGALSQASAAVLAEGALIRAVQIAGALERTLDHCLTWVNDRVQFGRPIARFQAIQHAMAQLASETAAARATVDLAVGRSPTEADRLAVAIAKSRTGEAAGKAAAIAHAAFGAMGFTREHLLHYTTRRLWAWRDDFGGEQVWQAEIGRHVAAGGGRQLWATLTALD